MFFPAIPASEADGEEQEDRAGESLDAAGAGFNELPFSLVIFGLSWLGYVLGRTGKGARR